MNNSAASKGVSPDVSFRNPSVDGYPESIYRFPTKDFGNDKAGQVENAGLSVPRGHARRRINLLTDIIPIFENKSYNTCKTKKAKD